MPFIRDFTDMKKFWEDKCLCCGKISLKKKLTFENSDLYICKNSCIFSKPKIDTNSLYTPEYFKSYYEDEINIAQKEMLVKLIFFLKKHLDAGSILDFGCGTGSFLINAEEYGFKDNIGVDVSKYATTIAQSKSLNTNFYNNKSALESKKFDCISFIDSIAHIEDVNHVFNELIEKNLNDNGVILIRTPNINKSYILYTLLIRFLIPKKYLSSLLFLPNRLFLFNIKSIKLFLHKHNLEIQECFLEPEFTSIPPKFVKNNFLKSIIDNILRVKIPYFLNKNNSLTLIARRKNDV